MVIFLSQTESAPKHEKKALIIIIIIIIIIISFFLGGRRGTRTPKHFVNLTEESKNFKYWNSR